MLGGDVVLENKPTPGGTKTAEPDDDNDGDLSLDQVTHIKSIICHQDYPLLI